MKALINTFSTAALTVLLFAACPPDPVLASVSVDTPISQASSGQDNAQQLEQTAFSGIQALALRASSMPTLPNLPKQRYLMVDAGGPTTCAIRAGGKGIDCFGFNQLGQAEPPKGNFKYLSMGQFHGCALTQVGGLKCWGDATAYPKPEEAKKKYKQVSAGTDHTCARTVKGELNCWGNNIFGELNVPSGQFIDVSAKGDHTCAIDKANNLLCWGDEAFTSYGPFTGKFTDLSTGNLHVCALRQSDKRAVCWGNNAYGQATPPIEEFVSLTSGSYHTCGHRADKSVTCWGKNDYGQATPDPRRFAQIAAGGNLTCALIQGSRRLACQGSFAFNDNLFKHGQGESTFSQSGMARPQGSLDSWLSGGLDWFGSSLSGGLDIYFSTDIKGWGKWAVGIGTIGSGLAAFLISNLMEAEDPNEARFKEIQQQLAEIKVSLSEISAGIQTLNAMLSSTNYMVAANWCDNSIATLASVEKDVRVGISYNGPIGNWRGVMDDYQRYLNEVETLKKTSLETKQPIDQSIMDQKLSALLTKVDQFKRDWLSNEPNGKNIERMRHDLTSMLLGGTPTSPLVACKAKSYQGWKSSPNLYPFDDRPIWAEASKVFIKSMSIQDQIADIETGVNAFEMMRVFQAPMKDGQGNPIPAYQWVPKDGDQGVCKLAESSQFTGGANPRLKDAWGDAINKGPCQKHQDLIKDIYLGQVRQLEFMGGAYSDDAVVLSMTSEQMGANPNDDNRGQSNWLFFRRADLVLVQERFSNMEVLRNWTGRWDHYTAYRPSDTGSPFAEALPAAIDGNFDFRQYLVPPTIDSNAYGESVWHSSGRAWKDVFQARQDVKSQSNDKDQNEDFMESMAKLKDYVKSCMQGTASTCKEVKIKDKSTGEEITVREPTEDGIRLFLGVSDKPFWVSNDDGSFPWTHWDMRTRSWEGGADPDMSARAAALPCFVAEKVNDGRDVMNWFHPYKDGKGYDEAKREYLKVSGKVCTNDEYATMLRTNASLGWKEGIDCTKAERCWGLNRFLDENKAFNRYKDYFPEASLVYENNSRSNQPAGQWGVSNTREQMNLFHMPVVKITGRACNPKVFADNIDAIWKGSEKNPVYSRRSGSRETGDGKTSVPSICGNDMDRMINRLVPKSPYIEMPGIRNISAQ